MNYQEFLDRKSQYHSHEGFDPIFMPDFLYDFQKSMVEWAIRKARAAIFADCGLGKTPMSLVWAENVVQKTNGRVLIVTPLAVSYQTLMEAEKFGIECARSLDWKPLNGITVTNYERLHHFDPSDFVGIVLDESSILKNFDGVRRQIATEFMRKMSYRLLCTATAAPNDYIELGTSSEALGYLGYMDMLQRFFKNDQNVSKPLIYRNKGDNFQKTREREKWRFKGHAELAFWRWVSSWARVARKPSDLGFEDRRFILPPLIESEHIVKTEKTRDGMLFPLQAVGLREQREERRISIQERCEKVGSLIDGHDSALIWCHLNDEGDLLENIIPEAVQVSGKDSDDEKEEKLIGFVKGTIKRLVTKPKIGAWGLNLQNCAYMTMFPSHSFEQYYQSVRRCWRFGQTRPVTVDIITTEGEQEVLKNMKRKSAAADKMFESLVASMNQAQSIKRLDHFTKTTEVPKWM